MLQSSFEKKLADTCGMMQKKELWWLLKESKETKKAKAFVYETRLKMNFTADREYVLT